MFAEARKELDLPLNAVGFSLPTTYWNRAFIFLFGFPVTQDVGDQQEEPREVRAAS